MYQFLYIYIYIYTQLCPPFQIATFKFLSLSRTFFGKQFVCVSQMLHIIITHYVKLYDLISNVNKSVGVFFIKSYFQIYCTFHSYFL